MNIQSRVAKLEVATGINKPCSLCSIRDPAPTDAKPTDCLTIHCLSCGKPIKIHLGDAPARVREAFVILDSYSDKLERITNPRARAVACWLPRQYDTEQTAMLERWKSESRFNAGARRNLALWDEMLAEANCEWEMFLASASPEVLEAMVDVNAMTDAELERIIWPDESIAA